ncbi:MAG TPA: Ig-like domain-containing protein, partial [Mycobacterium sp.]|nr:Ig-like domain-containing protein [Mycobacterium sp.]
MYTVMRGILALAGSMALVMGTSAGISQAAQKAPEPGFAVAAIEPSAGSVVGVAYPVIVTFAGPVGDRVAAERGIHITVSGKKTTDRPTGHFEWVSPDVVQWIPAGYWSPHSTISVDAHGMSTGFETGDAVVAVADI